jgi:uncharacterized GH25 family protein
MKRVLLALLGAVLPLHAHDTWVQLNTATTPIRQSVYADLMLGNHGNHHRDFQLASKIPLEGTTLVLVAPDGSKTDLKPSLIDRGSSSKEGFWSVRITPTTAGFHCVTHTYDAVVSYAPKRSLKCAKAFFRSGDDSKQAPSASFITPIGQPLEIVPLSDPTRLSSGDKLKVKVLLKGHPLGDAVISCIPQGKVLAEDFDPAHETRTDVQGNAELPLPEGNHYLVVVHYKAPEEKGEKYSDGTEYAATLTLLVGDR